VVCFKSIRKPSVGRKRKKSVRSAIHGCSSHVPVAADRPAAEKTHRLAALTIRETIELACGLLWKAETDTTTPEGQAILKSRKALLAQLDRDGQAWGIYLAQLVERIFAAIPGEMRGARAEDPPSLCVIAAFESLVSPISCEAEAKPYRVHLGFNQSLWVLTNFNRASDGELCSCKSI
jgi:hypothetical protein